MRTLYGKMIKPAGWEGSCLFFSVNYCACSFLLLSDIYCTSEVGLAFGSFEVETYRTGFLSIVCNCYF